MPTNRKLRNALRTDHIHKFKWLHDSRVSQYEHSIASLCCAACRHSLRHMSSKCDRAGRPSSRSATAHVKHEGALIRLTDTTERNHEFERPHLVTLQVAGAAAACSRQVSLSAAAYHSPLRRNLSSFPFPCIQLLCNIATSPASHFFIKSLRELRSSS